MSTCAEWIGHVFFWGPISVAACSYARSMLVRFVLVPLEMQTAPCMKQVWLSKRLVGSRTFLAGDVVPLQFERYLILRQTFSPVS